MYLRINLVLFFSLANFIFSQSNQQPIKEGAPNIFINCWYCDMEYIKEQIPIVNYVNDRKDADVFILSTEQQTGSGGYEYTLFFFGQRMFDNINDTIRFNSLPAEADDIKREKFVEVLKLGLIKYIAKSPVSDQVIISFKAKEGLQQPMIDDWDFWVFRTRIYGYTNGEEQYNYFYINGSQSASRVTELLKLYFYISFSYNEKNYEYDNGTEIENIKSLSRSQNFYAYSYFSIDESWSWGFSTDFFSSTYSNIDFRGSLSPEIEYNFFPYSESNERQLRLDYKISPTYFNYISETVYFKTEETLVSQQLSATLSLIEKWGSTSFSITGSNYFHDMSKYEFGLYGSISWQLFKGFSLDLSCNYSKNRNQLALARGEASLEEVLLRQRELESGYNFWGNIGISYSFGSIYNNIVNPRFGNY